MNGERAVGSPFFTEYRLADSRGDGRHPYLNEDGAFLGNATPLLAKKAGSWSPQPRGALEQILTAGYGIPVDLGWRMKNLSCLAHALNRGDRSLAAILLVHMELPALPDGGARRMAMADGLARSYNPNEPRVPAGNPGGGEWTSDDFATNGPTTKPDEQRVGWRGPVSSPECDEEWAAAARYCMDLLNRGLLGIGAYRRMGSTPEQCMRGQVSARCGGNPLG